MDPFLRSRTGVLHQGDGGAVGAKALRGRCVEGEGVRPRDQPVAVRKRNGSSRPGEEEDLSRKKAALLGHAAEMSTSPDFPAATLKEKVTQMLQQRHPFTLSQEAYKIYGMPGQRERPASPGREPPEEHPLKRRIKALMGQRLDEPLSNGTCPDGERAGAGPPGWSDNSKMRPGKSSHKGFEHFLSLLNKGVDAKLLNQVANDRGKEAPYEETTAEAATLPVTPPPGSPKERPEQARHRGFEHFLSLLNKGVDVELLNQVANEHGPEKTPAPSPSPPPPLPPPAVPPPLGSPSQRSESNRENVGHKGFQCFLSLLNRGVDMDLLHRVVNDELPDLCVEEGPSDGEGRDPRPAGRRDLHPEPSENGEEEVPAGGAVGAPPDPDRSGRDGGREGSPGARSQTAALQESRIQDPETAEVDEKHRQLRNILQTLGLSLEMEDLSGLTDRTQRRLYGKSPEKRKSPAPAGGSLKACGRSSPSPPTPTPTPTPSPSPSPSPAPASAGPPAPREPDPPEAPFRGQRNDPSLRPGLERGPESHSSPAVHSQTRASAVVHDPTYCDDDDDRRKGPHWLAKVGFPNRMNCGRTLRAVPSWIESEGRRRRQRKKRARRKQRRKMAATTGNPELKGRPPQSQAKVAAEMDVELAEPWQGPKILYREHLNAREHKVPAVGEENTGQNEPKAQLTEEEIRSNLRKRLEAFNRLSRNKSLTLPNPPPDTPILDD
ncbi:uncharacterized protein LOC144077484 [Stigmatopora argus]